MLQCQCWSRQGARVVDLARQLVRCCVCFVAFFVLVGFVELLHRLAVFRPARIWASAADRGSDQYTGITTTGQTRTGTQDGSIRVRSAACTNIPDGRSPGHVTDRA
eukprot:367161-Prymnesium_polylepis.1